MSDFASIETNAQAILVKAQQVVANTVALKAQIIPQSRIDAVDAKLEQASGLLSAVPGVEEPPPPPSPTGPPV